MATVTASTRGHLLNDAALFQTEPPAPLKTVPLQPFSSPQKFDVAAMLTTVFAVLLTTALYFTGNPALGDSSEANYQAVNFASSSYSIQKSDRLEAIRRYILERLNVSDNRRFNDSAVPTAGRLLPAPGPGHRPATRSFGSLPEALSFYATETKADGKPPSRVGSPVEDGVHRRRRRLHSPAAERTSSAVPKKPTRFGRGRSAEKRRHRKQIKLTMTADTGQTQRFIYTP